MNPEDQKLAAYIQGQVIELRIKRDELRMAKADCLCSPTGCCAKHAAVYHQLSNAIANLAWAMRDLHEEG